MDARFYNVEDLDIQQIANNLENIYRSQGYQTQQVNATKDQVMVQLKKGGDLEMLIGLQAALSVIIQRSGGGVVAMLGQQKWVDKAAVGAVGLIAAPILWPLMLTAGAGAIRQASLGNQVLNVVDSLVRQQRPEIQIGPVPVQVMPQIQQQWAPPPPQYLPPPAYAPTPQYVPSTPVVDAGPTPAAPPRRSRLRCPSCNTPYEPGDTFCTGCGKPLVTLCPNCKAEVKDNTAFCPKCGASIYQATLTQPATQSAPAPAPAPVYTPPAAQAPVYTPPPPKPQPASDVPVYTPPPAPTYTPPAPSAKPSYTPPPAQVTQPPAPVYTPPPTPQEPADAPKPTITYIQSSPQQTPPAPPKQPRKPDVPYYTPPVSPQQVSPKPKTPAQQPAPTPPPAPKPQPIQAKPSSQPTYDAKSVWGNLTFSDGTKVNLAGERAVVGRADHDIGGLQPEVDLSTMQGADTVSRIHAQIEHIGSEFTVTDLNSTNATRLNGKRLEPDKATPFNDGDTLVFGKVQSTFKKA
jgi:hypothetical protein